MKIQRKKSFIHLIQILLLVLLVSCKTTETNIYTLPHESGQLVFLRQVTLDDKHFILRNTYFDMTVIISDFQLTQNNTVNYTIHLPAQYYSYIDKVDFFFVTDTREKITPQNISTLYKDFDKKKNLEVRYSGTLSKDDLAAILENPSSTKVGLTIENQTHLFKSDDFSQKLFELGVLVQ